MLKDKDFLIMKRHKEVVRAPARVWSSVLLGVIMGFLFCQGTSYFLITFPHCRSTTHLPLRPDKLYQEMKTRQFVFVAVMTSELFIDRAKGVWETWGKEVPGKILFFVGKGNHSDKWFDIPLVQLDVEDDVYPPQTKSFAMLNYVCENFLDDYMWYIRADDDVYMRPHRLRVYLKQFNSSEDVLIGQPGIGKKDELGRLGLDEEQNFCIGGTGIIMSASVLRKIGPHLSYCLSQTASVHEDVEVGRCIRSFGGVICPWGYEAKEYFQQQFGDPREAYRGSLDTEEFDKGITFHPVKDPGIMRRIHAHFASSRKKQLLSKQKRIAQWLKNVGLYHQGKRNMSTVTEMFSPNTSLAWDHLFRIINGSTKQASLNFLHGSKQFVARLCEAQGYHMINFGNDVSGYMRVRPKLGVEAIVKLYTECGRLRKVRKWRIHHTYPMLYLMYSFGNFAGRLINSSRDVIKPIHFVVSIRKGMKCFRDFFESLEKEFLSRQARVKLLVVYFSDVVNTGVQDIEVFRSFATRYPKVDMKLLQVNGHFKRAVALQTAVNHYGNDSLLFYCDIDLVLRQEFAENCRKNSVLGKRVYFPIIFNYDSRKMTDRPKMPPYGKTGYLRHSDFASVCAYSVDIKNNLVLNTDYLGPDDVKLYDNFINQGILEIFRSPEPGLVHIDRSHAAHNASVQEWCVGDDART